MSGNEQKYINEAFESNWIAPLGPHVDCFEKEIANYIGTKGTVALSSGTAAIHLALKLLGIQKGDRVFVSSLTFIGSVNPILYEGAEPVFIDSDLESWNMSSRALENAIIDTIKAGAIPKAIIVVNLYGQSADMDPILEIARNYNIPVIEDAAESLGATYKEKQSGTFGKYGIFSFNGNKIITTSGGGALVSNDLDALKKAKFFATQARDSAPHYQHSEIGYNYRLSNILAAIGRAQLKVLDERINARREVYKRYHQILSEISGIEFMPEIKYGRSTRWLTVLKINPKTINLKISQIIEILEKENIESRPVWKPMHLQPLFRHNLFYSNCKNKSVAENLFNNGICLPSGSNLTIKDQQKVIEIITDTISRSRI